MSDESVRAQKLAEKLARLGVEEPEATARSEIEEDIPHLALARLERLVRARLTRRRGDMSAWWTGLERERERHPDSPTAAVADVVAACLAAGITLDDLGLLVEEVASETARGFAYLLDDPYDDELGDPGDLPSWVLCEVAPEDEGGELTGRTLGGLHEVLGPE